MRDEEHAAAGVGLAAEGLPQVGLGVGIQGARGLVEHEHRHRADRARYRARATATRCAWPPERPAPPAPSTIPGSMSDAPASARAAEMRPESRGTRAHVLGDRARHQPRPLARPGDRVAGVRDGDAVDAHLAVVRGVPEESGDQRRLPDAARAGHEHHPSGTYRQRYAGQRVSLAVHPDLLERHRRSERRGRGIRIRPSRAERAASSVSKISSVAATPSDAAWNCTPTWRRAGTPRGRAAARTDRRAGSDRPRAGGSRW